jgi:hypothetical protein
VTRRSYFRLNRQEDDPTALLDPGRQSEPWGGTIYGRCDKCNGSGQTSHECESCKASGPTADCPACHGEIRYRDECPACEGSGEIDDSSREGVSVFPDEDGLYRYMLKRDTRLGKCLLVELEGDPSEDEDFDADEGALLILPTRIVDCREPEWARLEQLREEIR